MKMQFNHSKARNVAKSMYGDVNYSYKTNRKGVYYFSCAGHGGYFVDGYALTEKERENIDKYVKPILCWVVYNTRTGKTRLFSNPYGFRQRSFLYYPERETLDQEYPIYIFEEDCEWSVLEYFTDIRVKEHPTKPERIEESFLYVKNYVENRVNIVG